MSVTVEKAVKKKLHIHCGGGGATRLAFLSLPGLFKELGKGFCDIELHYLDTSANDTNHYDIENKYIIKSQDIGKVNDGGGGDKEKNYKDIFKDIPNYLNEKNFTKPVTGELHIILTTAGGATGSMIGLSLATNMMQRKIPTMVIAITDTSSLVYANSSRTTISSLDAIAKKAKVALPVKVLSNDDGIKNANIKVCKVIQHISLFNNDSNISMDSADMAGFMNMLSYKTLSVDPGAYELNIFNGSIPDEVDEVLIGMRSLTLDKIGYPKFSHQILQYKNGIISDMKVLSHLVEKDGNVETTFPIFIALRQNTIVDIHQSLVDSVETHKEKMKKTQKKIIASEANDDGIEF